jgi:mannose-6-phosphate isomerase-like protein (cupin superfamily)
MTSWDVITNPVTGETVTFLERTPERLTFDLEIPPGGPGIVAHQHAWTEHFTVRRGRLDITVAGSVHRLGPGDELSVGELVHQPVNTTADTTVVTVVCCPGAAAERGLRAAFGLARDGGISPTGRPRDLLSLALLSEKGQFRIDGPPRVVWRPMIAGLALAARVLGRRRVVERYWPPDLARPW